MRRGPSLYIGLILGLGLAAPTMGCKKKAPPDRHMLEGFRLLGQDPQKALKEFEQARNQQDPDVLLGQALAYEGNREYAKAEELLEHLGQIANAPAALLPRARVRVMVGKADEARKDVDAVTAQSPSDISALLLEVCLANTKERASIALGHLEALPALRKNAGHADGLLAEYHMARASLYRQLGEPEKARAAESEASAVQFSSETVAIGLATVAWRAHRPDLSLRVLERLVDKSLDNAILHQAAVLCHAQGLGPLTEKALSKIPESSEEDARFLRLRAEHEFTTRPALAATRLRRAISATTDPVASAELQIMLADSLVRSRATDEARAVLETLRKKQPKLEAAVLALAGLDLAEEKPSDAIARLSPLASEGPSLAALELLARAEFQAKQFDQARAHLQELMRKAPGDHRALSGMVTLEIRQKHSKAAIALIEKALRDAPKDPELWLLLSGTLRKMGSGREAEAAALRRAVEALPKEPRLWLALASGPQDDDPKAALATLEQAEKLNQDSLPISAAIAALHGRLGQPTQALAYYGKVLRFAENEVGALNNTAMIYADDLHAPDKAVAFAERAHKVDPSHPAVTDTLGWALYRRGAKGDIARARELLESVKDKLTSPTSKYHLGMVLIASGAAPAGKELLRAALAMSKDFPEAASAKKSLGMSP
jgi:tetratricopeptide (TPR) repeat protein